MLCLLGVDEELAGCCVSLVGEESAEKAEGILSCWPVPLFDAYQREMGAERRSGRWHHTPTVAGSGAHPSQGDAARLAGRPRRPCAEAGPRPR